MKTAIVHDWIINLGGAERVLKEIVELFSDADVYTLLFHEDSLKKIGISPDRVRASFLQKIPFSKKCYPYLLPLMPNAIESFDLKQYDLVISSSHCVAKGVLTNSKQFHIAYVHTPMRYAWEMYHGYLQDLALNRGIRGILAGHFFKKLRIWDLATANRPDYYIANSKYVAKRIKKIYGKDSVVIYPPVDVEKFSPSAKKENFYITAGRLVSYKRVDVIVKAFSMIREKRLLIIGDGPELKRLKKIAPSNVEFLGYLEREKLTNYFSRARAFIFSAEEYFGIAPVEAQASGIPVISYRGGGAIESVIDGVTGIFFNEQTPEAVVQAINKFESIEDRFESEKIRKNSLRFSKEKFKQEFLEFIHSKVQ